MWFIIIGLLLCHYSELAFGSTSSAPLPSVPAPQTARASSVLRTHHFSVSLSRPLVEIRTFHRAALVVIPLWAFDRAAVVGLELSLSQLSQLPGSLGDMKPWGAVSASLLLFGLTLLPGKSTFYHPLVALSNISYPPSCEMLCHFILCLFEWIFTQSVYWNTTCNQVTKFISLDYTVWSEDNSFH